MGCRDWDELVDQYEEYVIGDLQDKQWAKELLGEGYTLDEVIELAWKDFPKWAEDKMCGYEEYCNED